MVFMNLLYNNNYETTIEICLINNKKTSSKPLVETIFEPYLIFVTAKLGKSFCDELGVPYVHKAGKPSAGGYRKAMELYGAAPSETLFFGDQIFTDIWGANRAGIDSVLVKPVDKSTDEIQIVFKRFLEKPFIKAFFQRKGLHF